MAYCLDPGRVYLDMQGREPEGHVEPGREYERLREELARGLAGLRDLETGEPMVSRVYRREEIYAGPLFDRAPDLLVQTCDGYDCHDHTVRHRLRGCRRHGFLLRTQEL